MSRSGFVCDEKFNEMSLILFPSPFEIEDLAEVRVRLVGNVDEICLYKRLGW